MDKYSTVTKNINTTGRSGYKAEIWYYRRFQITTFVMQCAYRSPSQNNNKSKKQKTKNKKGPMGMVGLDISLINGWRWMERWLIVDWMMHLIEVAMWMILGNCEILVLRCWGWKRLWRYSASSEGLRGCKALDVSPMQWISLFHPKFIQSPWRGGCFHNNFCNVCSSKHFWFWSRAGWVCGMLAYFNVSY
jgi:hypothetical protein